MLASNSVQEVMDMALIAQAATLESRVPFLHFFDGFRTSHEVNKIEQLTDDDMRAMIDDELVRAHRARALSPDRPFIRGTAQNPDVYFQGRETVQPLLPGLPGHRAEGDGQVRRARRPPVPPVRLRRRAGRRARDRDDGLGRRGRAGDRRVPERAAARRSASLKVRLYRPFSIEHFVEALPTTVKSIAVLDRTKEPGAAGEPLYRTSSPR